MFTFHTQIVDAGEWREERLNSRNVCWMEFATRVVMDCMGEGP